jgi:hypothetical protein
VLKAVALRSPSPDFNVFQAGIASGPNANSGDVIVYTTVSGDGTLLHSGGDLVVDHGKVAVTSSDPYQQSLVDLSFDVDRSGRGGASVGPWRETAATLVNHLTAFLFIVLRSIILHCIVLLYIVLLCFVPLYIELLCMVYYCIAFLGRHLL